MRSITMLSVLMCASAALAGPPEDERPVAFALPGARWIGIEAQAMTPALREAFGAPKDQGVLVSAFEQDSPAARSGLKVGDIIVKVGTQPVREVGDLYREISERKIGDPLQIEAVRDRKIVRADFRIEENPWWKARGDEMKKGRDDALRALEKRLDQLEHQVAEMRAQAKK